MTTYEVGFAARQSGAAIEDNPHQWGSEAWEAWASGWMDADDRFIEATR